VGYQGMRLYRVLGWHAEWGYARVEMGVYSMTCTRWPSIVLFNIAIHFSLAP
jgi:hypothetical protein